MIVFTLVIVLLMALAAIVIDVSLLRTDGQKLQNALDAGALAAGHTLPVNNTNVAANKLVARDYTRVNYPGMPSANVPDPTPAYACLIGIDTATGLPRVTRHAAGVQRLLRREQPQWKCTTAVCWAPCDPVLHPDRRLQHGHPDVQRHAALLLRARGRRQQRQHGRHHLRRLHGGVRLPAARACRRRASCSTARAAWTTRPPWTTCAAAPARPCRRSIPRCSAIALGFTGPTSPTRTTNGNYGNQGSSHPINSAGNLITSNSAAATSCTNASGYSSPVHAIAIDPDFHPAGNTPTYVTTYANAEPGGR